jgi:hypothetical protein
MPRRRPFIGHCNLCSTIRIEALMSSRRLSGAEIFAVLVSLASVAISVLGNRTQERLLAASVWPYVSFGSGNTSDDGQKQLIAFSLTNAGSGPARIKAFSLEYDHQKVTSGLALLERCCSLPKISLMTSPVVGRVLRPGDTITYLQLPFAESIADGWRKLDQARFGSMMMSVCYCSTLNECFEARSDRDDPQPVEVCRVPPRSEQWHG